MTLMPDPDLAFARAVHLYSAALLVLQPTFAFDDTPPSRSIFRRAVSALVLDPALLALVPHAALGTVSSLADLPLYAFQLADAAYPLLYDRDLMSEAAYLKLMRPFALWRVQPCATTPLQTLEVQIDRCFGGLATTNGTFTGIDLTHLSRFERRAGYADLGVRIHLRPSDGRIVACELPDGVRAAPSDDRAVRRCTTALLTSVTIEAHFAQSHFALSDRICTHLLSVPKTHPVRRLLVPLTNHAFFVSETGVPFLLGPRGFCAWTNFTQRGVLDLVAHATRALDAAWLLLGHAGECGAVAGHMHAWRACVRVHVRAFLALHPAIERDRHAAAFARTFASPSLPVPTIEDACTMSLLVPVVHELLSNPWSSAFVTNPFAASYVWRDAPSASPLAAHLPTLAEQIRVNSTKFSTMREGTRLDSPEWIDRCCATVEERAVYADFVRSVAALDIPPDAVLHPSNISSSVSF
jgi:hypothetical protein